VQPLASCFGQWPSASQVATNARLGGGDVNWSNALSRACCAWESLFSSGIGCKEAITSINLACSHHNPWRKCRLGSLAPFLFWSLIASLLTRKHLLLALMPHSGQQSPRTVHHFSEVIASPCSLVHWGAWASHCSWLDFSTHKFSNKESASTQPVE